MRVILLSSSLAAALGAGCARSGPLTPANTAQIVVDRLRADSGWRATWQFPGPVASLRFERPAAGFRGEVFRVETQGWTLGRDGELEVLRGGAAERAIAVRFSDFSRELDKEYELALPFTDGGVALYTGHLVAQPDNDSTFVRTFRINAPPGQNIVISGQRYSGTAAWRDTGDRGTYVYIGPQTPVESPSMISVIDPGLPAWLSERTASALPQLFALYRDRLGAALPVRPTVLFSYEPGAEEGRSYGGGTLSAMVQLRAQGRGWQTESRQALLDATRFLAHEAVHLWNGQVARYAGMDHSWLHEGSADALAERTLLLLGLINDDAFLDLQSRALNNCLGTLGQYPLREAAQRRAFGQYYTCGNVIALVTERSLGTSADLWTFWRSLIASSVSGDSTYTPAAYYDTWRTLGGRADALRLVQRLVDSVMSADALIAGLTALGIGVAPSEAAPPSYGQALVRTLMIELMRERCAGRFGFRLGPGGIVIDNDMRCDASLPAGARITAIAGHDVMRAGHLAWDAARERCASGGTLEMVASEQGRLTVPCTLRLSPRVPWYRLAR